MRHALGAGTHRCYLRQALRYRPSLYHPECTRFTVGNRKSSRETEKYLYSYPQQFCSARLARLEANYFVGGSNLPVRSTGMSVAHAACLGTLSQNEVCSRLLDRPLTPLTHMSKSHSPTPNRKILYLCEITHIKTVDTTA
jgi:hypothetical protein